LSGFDLDIVRLAKTAKYVSPCRCEHVVEFFSIAWIGSAVLAIKANLLSGGVQFS
jgi:hypothetical protein